MASAAAVPYWRTAGVTYISHSNICASLVPNCPKEPQRPEAAAPPRDKVHFASKKKWADGKPQKPGKYPSRAKLIMKTEIPTSKQSLPTTIKKEFDIEKMEVDSPTKRCSLSVLRSSQEVLLLEEEDLLMDVKKILDKQLPEGYNHIPSMNGRNQAFYEKILLETGSAKIFHNFKVENTEKVLAFSAIKIQRIITLSEWSKEGNPYITRKFIGDNKPKYTYYDYQDAWENVLYIQNNKMTHTWCINWALQTSLPNWFIYKFWKSFGATREILPINLRESIPLSEDLIQEDLNVLRFFSSHGIPWIVQWKWKKVTNEFPYFLKREIYVKWWSKYDFQGKTVPPRFSSHNHGQETKDKSSSFSQLKLELTTKYLLQNPDLTNEQLKLMVFEEICKIMDRNEKEECEKSSLEYDVENDGDNSVIEQ